MALAALHEDIDLADLETTISLDFDPSIVLFLDDLENSEETFENLTVDIEVDGDISEAERKLLEEGSMRSPVWNLMRLAHDMQPHVSRTDAERVVAEE